MAVFHFIKMYIQNGFVLAICSIGAFGLYFGNDIAGYFGGGAGCFGLQFSECLGDGIGGCDGR